MFLVEAYLPRALAADPDVAGRAAEAAADGVVRYVAGLTVPADELVFRVFDAESRDHLTAALQAASVEWNRVSEIVDFGPAGGLDTAVSNAIRGAGAWE